MKLVSVFVVALLQVPAPPSPAPPLVPQPNQVSIDEGKDMALPSVIAVSVPEEALWREHLEVVGVHLGRLTKGRHRLTFDDTAGASLVILRNADLAPEAYSLHVTADRIRLAASTLKGLAHGTATLLQLVGGQTTGRLPQLSINDAPRLSYRNFLIDMGRNPQSLELLKETVDLLWFYKVDSLQLHLTDDQRFAFPSTAFPKLWDGNLTVEHLKELEAYAVARGVTIIPELEVPGHSGLLRGIYPEVFGKTATELASTEAALTGIKTLLDEMLDVFSSTPYIHVGGDEAGGVPEELQRDLINTLHAYLKSKGRQTVVWEGPKPGTGDNKVNTEVIHLNWRTSNYPAGQMLDDGYRVVNAAWDPLYIVDHYPRTNFTMESPQHIYETLTLTRFRHVDPRFPTFANPVEVQPSDHLIGFCMPWWEGREENFLPLSVPRIIPLAEVAWDPGITRDFADFSARSERTEATRLAAFYPVAIRASDLVVPGDGVFHNETTVTLESAIADDSGATGELRYTLDGSAPSDSSTRYQQPIPLSSSTIVRAAVFRDGNQIGHGSRRTLTAVTPTDNLALGKPVTSSVSTGSPFSVQRITDGGTGNLDFYLGYPAAPEPIDITIDLERVQAVSRVVVFAYTVNGSFESYTVEVSADGDDFEDVASRLEKPEQPVSSAEHGFTPRDVRYVRIRSRGNLGYVFDSFSKVVEVQVYR